MRHEVAKSVSPSDQSRRVIEFPASNTTTTSRKDQDASAVFYPYISEKGIVVPNYPPNYPPKPRLNPVLSLTEVSLAQPSYSIFDLNLEQKNKRLRRRFSKGKKARRRVLHMFGACDECHEKHPKVRS